MLYCKIGFWNRIFRAVEKCKVGRQTSQLMKPTSSNKTGMHHLTQCSLKCFGHGCGLSYQDQLSLKVPHFDSSNATGLKADVRGAPFVKSRQIDVIHDLGVGTPSDSRLGASPPPPPPPRLCLHAVRLVENDQSCAWEKW